MNVLNVLPGDILVLASEAPWTKEIVENLEKEIIKKHGKEFTLMVLGGNYPPSVIRFERKDTEK